jgi:hypothetical protein
MPCMQATKPPCQIRLTTPPPPAPQSFSPLSCRTAIDDGHFGSSESLVPSVTAPSACRRALIRPSAHQLVLANPTESEDLTRVGSLPGRRLPFPAAVASLECAQIMYVQDDRRTEDTPNSG